MQVASVGRTPVVDRPIVAQAAKNDNDAGDKGGAGTVAAAIARAPDADNRPSGGPMARSSFAVQAAVTNLNAG